MGKAIFTPDQRCWRWYEDASPPSTAFDNEDVKPTLANNTDIIRLRVALGETGGANSTEAWLLQYSLNDTDWNSFGAAAHWNYANGADVEGDSNSILLSDADTAGVYIESADYSTSLGKDSIEDFDWAIVPTANVVEDQTYYFRVLYATSTVVSLEGTNIHPQVLSAPPGVENTNRSPGAGGVDASGIGATQDMGVFVPTEVDV